MNFNKVAAILLLLLTALAKAFSAEAAGIRLIENKGQWEPNVLYKASIPGGCFFIEKNRLSYFFYDEKTLHHAMHDNWQVDSIQCHVIRVNFRNYDPSVRFQNTGASGESYNYFIGNNPSHWASGVKAYSKITLKNLWKGIDMEIIPQDEALKYNFIVAPGSDPSQIQLAYEGADNVYLENENLHLRTRLCHIEEEQPVARQKNSHAKRSPSCRYELKGNILSFKTENYVSGLPLIIDPLVIFATYSGSTADNFGFTGTYDRQGNGYSGGTAFSTGFPTTTGAFQVKYQGGFTDYSDPSGYITEYGRDAAILKYSPDGKRLLWATYLGGSNNEQPHSMVVNRDGELIILGTTSSKNFPTVSGSYDQTYHGKGDIFICKLSQDGSKLTASTFIGGAGRDGLNGPVDFNLKGAVGPLAYNYGDLYRGEVIVDSNGSVLIASCTRSTDFPLKNAWQKTFNGVQEACVLKLSGDLSSIIWSTFLGGKSDDAAYGINFDSKGNIFVTGGTLSKDFPTSPGSAFTTQSGDVDGFLSKLDKDKGSLLASTFIGTFNYDQSYFVQLDGEGKVYVTGQTEGQFPVSTDRKLYVNKNGKQFIAMFSNDLSKMEISTVFGTGRSTPDISPSAFLVDLCGRVCVSGWGGQVNNGYSGRKCSTFGLETSADAFQKKTDGSDFYLLVLGREMSSLVYATFLGGNESEEHVDGGTSRFDFEGKVYQSVCGGCGGFSDFPTTPNAWSRLNLGSRPLNPREGGCNNALFKMDLNSSNYIPEFKDTTLVVVATDLLTYRFTVTDRDAKDSLYLNYSGSVFDAKKMKGNPAHMSMSKGVGSITAVLSWQTACFLAGTDTYTVEVIAYDNGCPTPKFRKGYIKIVIQGEPLPVAPGMFCIRRLGPSRIGLSWGDFPDNQHLSEYHLVKEFPDGHSQIVYTFSSRTDDHFYDDNVPDYANQNYCYYIYGTNMCENSGDTTRKICTLVDKDSIPAPTYIHTVTVVDNKTIKVVWNSAHRADFYTYQIYRKANTPGSSYILLAIRKKNANDTIYVDSSVNVHTTSYCYMVRSGTQCGIFGPQGNYGCSILLKGESIPFENHVSWNPYEEWQGGVASYHLERQDTAEFFSLPAVPGTTTSYNDNSLNYDWGLYHYKVVAHEGTGGQNAVSESNVIELIQKPVLYAPNVFTPNGDSLNDGWKPVPAFVKDFHLKIFNRWGEQVWESDNKKRFWNGIYKENDPFMNVFIWQTDYTGWDKSTHYSKGNITILR